MFTNKILSRQDSESIGQEYDVEQESISSFSVLKEKTTSISSTTDLVAFVDGYLREFNSKPGNIEEQIKTGIDSIADLWPVEDNITGSFSCAIINKLNEEVILCNDSIGVYPLYYLHDGNFFYVSNSIIWLGVISKAEIDEVGVFQRTYCPEFATIGSRTILKNCKRLLPGEWIKFKNSGEKLESRYDNELYRKISSSNKAAISPDEYWQQFKKEITYCTGESENVHIALSGGMDSRLILGGVPAEKNLSCHTYGGKDYYETQIAERIAKLKEADFKSYSRPNLNFPSNEILKRHTLRTEGLFLSSWLEILEAQEKSAREVLLLGDMTESLQGRNLAIVKGGKTYWDYYINQKEYPFKENNRDNFKSWKKKVITTYSSLVSSLHINRLNFSLSEEMLRNEIRSDLEDVFSRIEAHRLPFLELNQELFSWLTHARNPMGKQIIQLNSDFKSYCPSMSVQSLRLTSNIHPNLRVNGRFMKKLFSSVEELRIYGEIPTSQIPFISYNSPDIFRVPIWFLRSKVDGFLIKKLMKSRRPDRRYRLLKSYNWVQIYQNPDLEKNLRSYFEKDHLGENYTEAIIKGALSRRDLEKWPLANINIINAAALNAELDIISSLKNGNEI